MTRHEPLTFINGRGEKLAGIVDMPDIAPVAYGVFAPCFTCVKETHGAVKISRALAERGVAMLRFDTAGVGASEGTLSKTNFSSRIDDIVSACRAFGERYASPSLLVGHSISGPAAISAAVQLPDIRVVATVGSPKDPQTMLDKFEERGQMTVTDIVTIDVLGRALVFDRLFIDDLRGQDLVRDSAAFTGALLAFHAPNDAIVGMENMQGIYDRAVNATHREMVRLGDDSTHLFEKHNEDAAFIADKLLQFL
jgi:pimeloyl-ACP methyl ester carboxylesterase